MSALVPDERFDLSAIDAIEEARPTPPDAPSRPTYVVVTDESGPLWSYSPGGKSWRYLEAGQLTQLLKAAHPGLNVVKVEWASNPKLYSAHGDDVLLVSIPGTHEVTVAKPRAFPKRKREPDYEPWDPSDEHEREPRTYWSRSTRVSAPAVPKVEKSTTLVVNTCPCCGTAHTEASWESLPLLSSRDVREGDVVLHEVMRTCGCGSTRMVTTQRVSS